jgi:hypothetical protein
MENRVIEYPPDYISLDEVERCRPWIEAALRYSFGTHTFADVIDDIGNKNATLWPFEKSAVVTQIAVYPRITILNFWLAGGNMKDMLAHEPGIVEWGKLHGCTRFSVPGRKGWSRAMRHLGYEPKHYICSRED